MGTTSTVRRLYVKVERLGFAVLLPSVKLPVVWRDPQPIFLAGRGFPGRIRRRIPSVNTAPLQTICPALPATGGPRQQPTRRVEAARWGVGP